MNINFFLNKKNYKIFSLNSVSMETEELESNKFIYFIDNIKSKLHEFFVFCQEEITALQDIIQKMM